MTTAKFAWNEKSAAFFVAAYTNKLEEDKIAANSEEFLQGLMEKFALENDGLKPVSVRSVRQKLASEKVYQKLEASERPKTERASKGKKINKVAKLAEIIAKKTEIDESEIFDAIGSVENATVKCLDQLISLFESGVLLAPEDDGSAGE